MQTKKPLPLQEIVNEFNSLVDGSYGDLNQAALFFGEPQSDIVGSLAFIKDPKWIETIEKSQVVAAIAPSNLKETIESSDSKKAWIFSKNPELLAREVKKTYFFNTPYRSSFTGVHPSAIVASTAELAPSVTVGPFAVIGENCKIGDDSFIGSHAVIEDNVTLQNNVTIHPHAYIGHSTQIGNDCEIMPQAIIGSEGFGYAHDHLGNHYRIPHTGKVILEDDVHIGAGTAIDRGTISDTRIGRGCKIDNHVHLAHNTVLGKNGIITAQVVTAGSTTIGDNFICGGKTAITGHIKIADNVNVAGFSGVSKSIERPGQYGGYPLLPIKEHLKVKASSTHIVEIRKQVAKLMKKVFNE